LGPDADGVIAGPAADQPSWLSAWTVNVGGVEPVFTGGIASEVRYPAGPLTKVVVPLGQEVTR
jgi:hypothetical protein